MKIFKIISIAALIFCATNANAQEPEPTFKVMTYNIWNGFDWGKDTTREAQLVDVADELRAQVVQRPLASLAQAHLCLPQRKGRDSHPDHRDHRELNNKANPHLVTADDPFVDRLLDQDRHDDAAGRAHRSETERQPQAVTQDRRRLRPLPTHKPIDQRLQGKLIGPSIQRSSWRPPARP